MLKQWPSSYDIATACCKQLLRCAHDRFTLDCSVVSASRVIFRWLTVKNLRDIRFTEEASGSPEEILTNFKRQRGSFARIFELMSMQAVHIIYVSRFHLSAIFQVR